MDKAKKKRIKKYITWFLMAAVVALLAAMPLLARQEAEADGPVASTLSAKVSRGTITAALHGGGNIDAETVEEIRLPSGVKITGFLVKNGQFVTEGTPLATLDKVSVMTAITQVGETLDYLREELEDARDETVSSTITAKAGGRVKKIFASAGESVQDVMLRDGCLAILSLDGMMAVKLREEIPLGTGESVIVTLENGAAVTGRVESNLDGVIVITVEDEGYEVGQTVTVTNADGTLLGQGQLYIHNAWKATAYTGTVEAVKVKEERTLSSGAALFTLTDRDYEGELRRRSNQHREYEELLQDLFRMYDSGVITAPCDGEVEGVDEDSAFLLSAVPQGWVVAPLNSTVSAGEPAGYRVMLLSNHACSNSEYCELDGDSDEHLETCPMRCIESIQCKAKKHHTNCIRRCDSDNRSCPATVHYDGCISVCTGKTGCQALPQKHLGGCPEKCTNNASCVSGRPLEEHESACIVHCAKDTNGADGYQCSDTHAHYDICIGKCSGTKNCTAINHKADCELYGVTYTAIPAIVVRSASGTIEYKYDRSAGAMVVERAANGSWTLPTNPSTQTMNDTGFITSATQCSAGSIILIVTAVRGNEAVYENRVFLYSSGSSENGSGNTNRPGGGSSGFGGMGGFSMTGGMAGFGGGSTAAQADEGLFDLEGSTLLTVTPHHSATLIISIDEHDIAKLSPGMKATVKVEALKGQEFEAEITAIGQSGTNNGGSSKFSVELTLPMTQDMLSGMSASAVIPLEEKQEILRIPAAALVQQGARTYVCTSLDEKTGKPASPVEVTTGITDGEYVEVISGLSEGQKIYYSYYDTVELNTSAEASKYSF